MLNDSTLYEIRSAEPDDERELIEFNMRLAWETEQVRLDSGVVTAGVRAVLNDSRLGRYFVACHGNHVVGQLMHTTEWSDWRNGHIWWLQSVYVVPEHRGRGVFRSLFEHIRRLAELTSDVVGLRLYVEHANEAAQRVYQRLGLQPTGYQVFERLWRRETFSEASRE